MNEPENRLVTAHKQRISPLICLTCATDVQVGTWRRCPCFFIDGWCRLLQALKLQGQRKFAACELTLRRFKPSPCYSEAQLAQLQGARVRLGDLHRAAERELQHVLNSYLPMRQYAAAGETFKTLATASNRFCSGGHKFAWLPSPNPRTLPRW